MNREEFIQHAYNKVMSMVEEGHTPDSIDEDCILNCIKQCFDRGFTVRDSIKYTRLTEHVSPSLTERDACNRMNQISKYYPSFK